MRRHAVARQPRVECNKDKCPGPDMKLTGAPLAPRDGNTLHELRRKRPVEQMREIAPEIAEFVPTREFGMDVPLFAKCLRSAPSGSSPGPGGCSNEILRVCLDDTDTLLLLTAAAEDFARASVSGEVFRVFMLARMTALQKPDGGVRGIATGTVFRRLVAKTLARQHSEAVEEACSPFQFALSTRAGVDCVVVTQSDFSQTRILKLPCSPWTASARMTTCTDQQCCRSCLRCPSCKD